MPENPALTGFRKGDRVVGRTLLRGNSQLFLAWLWSPRWIPHRRLETASPPSRTRDDRSPVVSIEQAETPSRRRSYHTKNRIRPARAAIARRRGSSTKAQLFREEENPPARAITSRRVGSSPPARGPIRA